MKKFGVALLAAVLLLSLIPLQALAENTVSVTPALTSGEATLAGTTITLTQGVPATIAFRPGTDLDIIQYQYSEAQPASVIATDQTDWETADYLVPTYTFNATTVGSFAFTLTITDNDNGYATVFQQEYTVVVNEPEPTPTPTPTATPEPVPTPTPAPVVTPTPEPTATLPPKVEVVAGPGAPSIQVDSSQVQKFLTQEELDSGATVAIDIQKVTPSTEQQAAVEQSLATNQKVAFYLDITPRKVVDGQQTAITQTASGVRLTILLPEGLWASGRQFVVVRLHEGKATVLKDLDQDPKTITIETDQFSVYALAYADAVQPTPTPNPNAAPKTGDPVAVEWLVLTVLAISGMLAGLMLKKKNAQ